MLSPFKARFFHCMEMIYPDGVSSQEQLRDLIRTFSMGWLEALMLAECKEPVQAWVSEFAYTFDVGWWPDDSWKWWLGNN